jgi:transcriptional regulator with XRE-family HTH domain
MQRTFGEAVRSLMQERHLTIRQFSKRSTLTISTIWRIRKMKTFRECHPTTFQRLATGFGITVYDFHELAVGPHVLIAA